MQNSFLFARIWIRSYFLERKIGTDPCSCTYFVGTYIFAKVYKQAIEVVENISDIERLIKEL